MIQRTRVFIFIFFHIANCYCNSQLYTVQNSTNVSNTFHQKNLISETLKLSKFQCLAECNKNLACASVAYSIDQDANTNCFLYNNTVNVSDRISSNEFKLFQKSMI